MKILIDMNLSFRWADMLIAEGIEAVYWDTLGPANAPDAEIMAYAAAQGYTVLSRLADEIEGGTIITIDQHKTRIHILPFSSKG
jgi:predicted nuclease of predicted toxin-antitoxin system